MIRLQGSIGQFHEGDGVSVGPTPLSKLRIDGTVEGRDDTANAVILSIDGMEAPTEASSH